MFGSLEICRLGGKRQRLTVVHAVPKIAQLIEQHCIGTFFFLERPDPPECRLWCVALADGPHGVDLETLRKIIPTFAAGRVADAP